MSEIQPLNQFQVGAAVNRWHEAGREGKDQQIAALDQLRQIIESGGIEMLGQLPGLEVSEARTKQPAKSGDLQPGVQVSLPKNSSEPKSMRQ